MKFYCITHTVPDGGLANTIRCGLTAVQAYIQQICASGQLVIEIRVV